MKFKKLPSQIGSGSRHYRAIEFDELVKSTNKFVVLSQFTPHLNSNGEVARAEIKIVDKPAYACGELLYGLIKDSFVLLAFWVDSSD